jgi:hypothetical protein
MFRGSPVAAPEDLQVLRPVHGLPLSRPGMASAPFCHQLRPFSSGPDKGAGVHLLTYPTKVPIVTATEWTFKHANIILYANTGKARHATLRESLLASRRPPCPAPRVWVQQTGNPSRRGSARNG